MAAVPSTGGARTTKESEQKQKDLEEQHAKAPGSADPRHRAGEFGEEDKARVQKRKVRPLLNWTEQLALSTFMAGLEWIQAATLCADFIDTCARMAGWAIAVGLISMILTFSLLMVDYDNPEASTEDLQFGTSLFLTIWWLAGAISITYFWYFTGIIAVGYFTTWGTFLLSLAMLRWHSRYFGKMMTDISTYKNSAQSSLIILMIASAVEFGAALGPCCYGLASYAVALGVISECVAIVVFILNATDTISRLELKLVGMGLMAWWVVGATMVSIAGPFIIESNGLFGSFFALAASYALIRSSEPDEENEEPINVTSAEARDEGGGGGGSHKGEFVDASTTGPGATMAAT